jgi:hypothetical protein
MTQVSASQQESSSKMTNSGLAFVAASIVIGMGFGGGAFNCPISMGRGD